MAEILARNLQKPHNSLIIARSCLLEEEDHSGEEMILLTTTDQCLPANMYGAHLECMPVKAWIIVASVPLTVSGGLGYRKLDS